MSMEIKTNIYIVAKSKKAFDEALTILINKAFPSNDEYQIRLWFDANFKEPRRLRGIWFSWMSEYVHTRMCAALIDALDGMCTDDYVVYAEVPDTCEPVRCFVTGLHENVQWTYYNKNQAYQFIEDAAHHQPSQERG